MDYTIYFPDTGFIHRFGSAGSEAGAAGQKCPPGAVVLVGYAYPDDLYYVVAGDGVPRPSLDVADDYTIAADGVDAVDLVFPVDVAVEHNGAEYPAETTFHFDTDTAGTFVFRLDPAFPYKPLEVTIHAA